MRVSKIGLAALALTSGLALGGCAYGFGDPYGSYGSLGVGYGNYGYGYGGYPYGGYGYGYPYGGYGNYIGYGYGGYPYGWYDGFYYPGTGYYVYDRDRTRRVWTDAERRYWQDKFHRFGSNPATTTTTTTTSVTPRENWSGFNRIRTRGANNVDASTSRGSDRNRWHRSSATTTTSSSSDTTTTRRANGFFRNRGHSNEQ